MLCGQELQDLLLPVGAGSRCFHATSVNRPGGGCRAEFGDAPAWRIMIGLR